MNDARFDALLQDVCRDIAAHDLAAARRCASRRPRKTLRVVIPAAAIAALCTLGAVAVWPQVTLRRTASNSYRMQTNIDGAAAALTPAEFGYVPEGFVVEETPGDNGSFLLYGFKAAGSGAEGYPISVRKYPLDYTARRTVVKVDYYNADGTLKDSTDDMDPESAGAVFEDVTDDRLALTVIVESREDITLELMQRYSIVVFPTGEAYYEVMYTPSERENALRIIQNMS